MVDPVLGEGFEVEEGLPKASLQDGFVLKGEPFEGEFHQATTAVHRDEARQLLLDHGPNQFLDIGANALPNVVERLGHRPPGHPRRRRP